MAGVTAAKSGPSIAGGDEFPARIVARTRDFSAEFPQLLANHLPMVLVALRRLGGSDQRLIQYFNTYRDANGLVPAATAGCADRARALDRGIRRP